MFFTEVSSLRANVSSLRRQGSKFFVTLGLSILLSIPAYASHSNVYLILDSRNVSELPRNFRMMNDLFIAGGAQYSELELKEILVHLGSSQITVIDLRQESHGFLDGNAVSWYGPQDAANAGKTQQQIERDQSRRLANLRAKKKVMVDKVLKKSGEGVISTVKPIEFVVHSVQSEAELAKKYHLSYSRIYVQDFHAPSDKEVDRFIQLIKKIPPQHWIYFHCHAGVGRTTTFMTMFDMMHNAKQATFEEIIARQKAIGGKDLTVLPSHESFKYAAADDRMEFLRKFYNYARTNKDDFKTSWTAWSSS